MNQSLRALVYILKGKALAIIHSIVLKLISQGDVQIKEIDPPYEKYSWMGDTEETQGF